MSAGEAGRVIAGRYTLREELGRGGMGLVWRAQDETLDREVAVKEVVVPAHLTEEEREQAHVRIRREGQTAARIPHPAVITIHDVVDFDERPWIVMELIRGRSLQKRLQTDGPVTPDHAHAIAATVLGALDAAHQMGVVHRDVKPANILLADDGRIILTDFGIAFLTAGTALTRTGALIGSPEYMAPECLEHEKALPGSDLWSLGATLHAAVDGSSPFHRETLTGTITAVVALPIPPPAHAGHLTPVITGLLQRDVEKRLTAERCWDVLRRSRASVPVEAVPEGMPQGEPGTPNTGVAGGGGAGASMGPAPGPPPPPQPGAQPGPATGPRPAVGGAMGPPVGPPGLALPPPPGGPGNPQPGPPGPPAGQLGPPPPTLAAPSAPTERHRRRRMVLGAVVATVALLVIVVVSLVVTWPLSTPYERYEGEYFALDYPEGWDYGELIGDDTFGARFRNPSGDITLGVYYEGERENTPLEVANEYAEFDEQGEGSSEDLAVLDPPRAVTDGVPSGWTVAEVGIGYVDESEYAPERHYLARLINVGDAADYTIVLDTPVDEFFAYRRIREEIFASFEPRE